MSCLCWRVLSSEMSVGWGPWQGVEGQNPEGPRGSALFIQSPLTTESTDVPEKQNLSKVTQPASGRSGTQIQVSQLLFLSRDPSSLGRSTQGGRRRRTLLSQPHFSKWLLLA